MEKDYSVVLRMGEWLIEILLVCLSREGSRYRVIKTKKYRNS
jgi:hypothetical protein